MACRPGADAILWVRSDSVYLPSLLTAIVVWPSANFGLPANYELPRIERM